MRSFQILVVVGLAAVFVTVSSASPTSIVPACFSLISGFHTCRTKFELVHEFFRNFIYPKNEVIAKAGTTTLFAPDIQGRVDITSTFDGMELNVEYVFGLFSTLVQNKDRPTLLGVPIAYRIVAFTATGNLVTASAVVEFQHQTTKLILPIQMDMFVLYDRHNRIQQYDAVFRRYANAVAYQLPLLTPYILESTNSLDLPKDQVTPELVLTLTQKMLAGSICDVHEEYCTGPNQQYDSRDKCTQFLTTQVRLGTPTESGSNTVLCRQLHEAMVPFRPDVHCPHIGPSGGGMCIDRSYPSVVNQVYFKRDFVAKH